MATGYFGASLISSGCSSPSCNVKHQGTAKRIWKWALRINDKQMHMEPCLALILKCENEEVQKKKYLEKN